MDANENPENAADPADAVLAEVIKEEIEQIRITRRVFVEQADRPVESQSDGKTVWQQADGMKLTGLALSGGGIRSATFCLGVIQSLCEGGLLRQFDYLSTVSGGGYIGGWLSAQIYHRCGSGTPLEIESLLSPNEKRNGPPKGAEDPSIGFLREYSNYLTPKLGLLSTDTLAAIAAYLRNLVLIQSILILMLVVVLFLPRLLFLGAHRASTLCSGWFLGVAVVLLFVSVFGIRRNLQVPNDSGYRENTPCTAWHHLARGDRGVCAGCRDDGGRRAARRHKHPPLDDRLGGPVRLRVGDAAGAYLEGTLRTSHGRAAW